MKKQIVRVEGTDLSFEYKQGSLLIRSKQGNLTFNVNQVEELEEEVETEELDKEVEVEVELEKTTKSIQSQKSTAQNPRRYSTEEKERVKELFDAHTIRTLSGHILRQRSISKQEKEKLATSLNRSVESIKQQLKYAKLLGEDYLTSTKRPADFTKEARQNKSYTKEEKNNIMNLVERFLKPTRDGHFYGQVPDKYTKELADQLGRTATSIQSQLTIARREGRNEYVKV